MPFLFKFGLALMTQSTALSYFIIYLLLSLYLILFVFVTNPNDGEFNWVVSLINPGDNNDSNPNDM